MVDLERDLLRSCRERDEGSKSERRERTDDAGHGSSEVARGRLSTAADLDLGLFCGLADLSQFTQ